MSGPDVIIIGAGMSGLAAGIRLAHFGQRVVIFERHRRIGGLNSYYTRDGIEFDVGLHAMTNLAAPEQRSAPLNKLFRQLRLQRAALRLCPQRFSRIVYPQAELRFANDPAVLLSSIEQAFPGGAADFRVLSGQVNAYDAFALQDDPLPAGKVLRETIRDPMLADMLRCPLLWYGGTQAHDLSFKQFAILFHSVFQEGLGRPLEGIRPLLDLLTRRLQACGGEVRLGCGVSRILCAQGRAVGVELQDGSTVTAPVILSSAGYPETMSLCEAELPASPPPAGDISFIELIAVLDCPPAALGFDETIRFFSHECPFPYGNPRALWDPRSGVICAPGNFHDMPDGSTRRTVRLTRLADSQSWAALNEKAYRDAKHEAVTAQLRELAELIPGCSGHVVATDLFTPRTIQRYTGHLNGAVYGTPEKRWDGTTPMSNLFICGTDQGFMGIVGSLLSGVSVVNRHLLLSAPVRTANHDVA
jgi:phytoene dehydrogenase-like protein